MDTVTLNQEENMVPEYEYKHVQKKAVKLLKENMLLKAKLKYFELVSKSEHPIVHEFNKKAALYKIAKKDFVDPRIKFADQIQEAYDDMIDIQSIVDGEL